MSNMVDMDDVKKDINEFQNLHPNRKLAVFGIVLFVFVLSIIVGIYFSRMSDRAGQDNRQQPEVELGASKLMIVPEAEAVAVGDTITVSVMIEGEAVPITDVVISYDPEVFAASDVANGSVYDSIIRESIENGQIMVTAAVSPSNPDLLRTGEIFTFTLEALKPGTSELTFITDDSLKDTTIAAKDGRNTIENAEGDIIPESVQGTTITVQ